MYASVCDSIHYPQSSISQQLHSLVENTAHCDCNQTNSDFRKLDHKHSGFNLRDMDAHQQQFCLKWNSFGNNLATAFSNLFKSESLTDVTLFCEGVTFKAHKLILAACSKHFQELFEGMPPSPAGLIVILDGTNSHNMASLLEFMYRGEVHVSQESLSSFLKAAEYLQVKGLSIEHEKLAVAHTHFAENNSSNGVNNTNNEILETETTTNKVLKRESTPSSLSGSSYIVPNIYNAHYYDGPPKKAKLIRSPSEIDTLSRVSVLRDGTAFRPASAPHPLLLENHFYQSFNQPPENLIQSYTAPQTPTELERETDPEISDDIGNSETKQNVAEDLRIKQEPVTLSEQDKSEKLVERLSGENYARGRVFESNTYELGEDSKQIISSLTPGIVSLAHPLTPDLSPAPITPARWNSKVNKAGTVCTPDGKKLKCPFCDRLYGYETNLRAHVRQRHQGIRVSCPFCSRTFTRNNTVRRHIAREHKNEINIKPFQSSGHQVSDSVPQ